MSPSFVAEEIASQPACWRRVPALLDATGSALPRDGERVAVVGCGTSWFMAMAYASLREGRGLGITDACTPEDLSLARGYDRIVAISRSGTTTEVLEMLERASGRAPRVAITAVPDAMSGVVDDTVSLAFADERSVVQTRFATTLLALLRASLGEDVGPLADAAEDALGVSLDGLVEAEQFTFIGSGWTVGLAHEAALKLRESAQAWTEAYPALQYRHGPISIAMTGRVTWMLGVPPRGLAEQVRALGATFRDSGLLDPMADLVIAQRLAVALAVRQNLDPDRPRGLTRSVVLEDARRATSR
jgi:fructoselysine-6-P-deglycase FrlB-like protein